MSIWLLNRTTARDRRFLSAVTTARRWWRRSSTGLIDVADLVVGYVDAASVAAVATCRCPSPSPAPTPWPPPARPTATTITMFSASATARLAAAT
uniref:Uncharacterized protein n=1 Tax=Macrostomum lignano TaxID=282301 RepID=A0A1I8IIC1_9PLAT